MNFQEMLLSNTKLVRRLLPIVPSKYWEMKSRKNAINVCAIAALKTQAYNRVLTENNISVKNVRNINDFSKLPVLDKKNYIQKYDLGDLVINSDVNSCYTIEKSSGHSGKSHYWPRISETDRSFSQYLELAFLNTYEIDHQSTLVIVTFALGTWTTGEKTADALRRVAMSKKYKLTVITPGEEIDEIAEIVRDISPLYNQTVILGYPPLIKSVIDQLDKMNVDPKPLKIKIGLGGEGHTEAWREHVAKKLGTPKNRMADISSAYGSADVGIGIGREYPISILLRRLAQENKELAHDLFGDCDFVPCLYQFNADTYIESVNGELVFTAMNGIPVVRYNIHDKGGVFSFDRGVRIAKKHGYNLFDMLKKFGYDRDSVWKLPFFYVVGRSDGAVSLYGANIYPENIDSVFYTHEETFIVESYMLSIEHDEQLNAKLVIHLQLQKDVPDLTEAKIAELKETFSKIFFDKLVKSNRDFKDAFRGNPRSGRPEVKIYYYGEGHFAHSSKKIKKDYILNLPTEINNKP